MKIITADPKGYFQSEWKGAIGSGAWHKLKEDNILTYIELHLELGWELLSITEVGPDDDNLHRCYSWHLRKVEPLGNIPVEPKTD